MLNEARSMIRVRGKLCLDGKRRITKPNANKAIERIEAELLSMLNATPASEVRVRVARGAVHRLLSILRNLWSKP